MPSMLAGIGSSSPSLGRGGAGRSGSSSLPLGQATTAGGSSQERARRAPSNQETSVANGTSGVVGPATTAMCSPAGIGTCRSASLILRFARLRRTAFPTRFPATTATLVTSLLSERARKTVRSPWRRRRPVANRASKSLRLVRLCTGREGERSQRSPTTYALMRSRPLSRRRFMRVRPARVRWRARNPIFLFRRRLFGW